MMADARSGRDSGKAPGAPRELLNIGGTAAALFAVVVAGGWLAGLGPANVWLTAASYGAPAALAFAAYCWVSRRV